MTAGLSDMVVSFVFRKLSYKGYTSSSEYEPLAQRDTPVPTRDPHVRKSRHCARVYVIYRRKCGKIAFWLCLLLAVIGRDHSGSLDR